MKKRQQEKIAEEQKIRMENMRKPAKRVPVKILEVYTPHEFYIAVECLEEGNFKI